MEKHTHALPVLVCQGRGNPHFSSRERELIFLSVPAWNHASFHVRREERAEHRLGWRVWISLL